MITLGRPSVTSQVGPVRDARYGESMKKISRSFESGLRRASIGNGMVGVSQEVVQAQEEASGADLSGAGDAVIVDVEEQDVDLAGRLRGNHVRVGVRTPRRAEDAP